MLRRTMLIAFWLLLVVPSITRAEVPLISSKELSQDASHVVRGKVERVYSSTERDGNWENTKLVAQIAVDKVEKGSGIDKAKPVYVRYWRTNWIGKTPAPPHSGGHDMIPLGAECRLFLSVNEDDGGYDMLLPNGVEVLKEKKK